MRYLWKLALFPLVLASVCPAFAQGKTKTTSPTIVKQFKTTLDVTTIPVVGTQQETGNMLVYTAPETGLYRISMQFLRHLDQDCETADDPMIYLSVGVGSTTGQLPGGAFIANRSCVQGTDTNGSGSLVTSVQANAGSALQWSLGVNSGYQTVYTGTIDVYIVIERLM